MVRRPLGATGIEVSILGLGTVKIGRNQQVRYPGGSYALPDDAAVERLLDAALDLGINVLDTAPAYGTSEERLGKLLGGRRDRFVLVTKVGEEFVEGRSTYDFSPAHITRSVERSLTRLGVDHVDCLLLHCDPQDVAVRDDAVLLVLDRLKSAGVTRAVGASTHSVDAGIAAVHALDVAMVAYSADDRSQEPVIREADRLGKGVLIKKGLNSGHAGVSAAALESSLRQVVRTKGVSSVIVGTLSLAHLAENARLVEQAVNGEA